MNSSTDEQRALAVAVLTQELMKSYELVRSSKNASGGPLGQEERISMTTMAGYATCLKRSA